MIKTEKSIIIEIAKKLADNLIIFIPLQSKSSASGY